MSLNATALDPVTSLPVWNTGEKVFITQDNVRLECESGDGYPGSTGSLYSKQGCLYLTNMRAVYIPSPPIPGLSSLTIPLLNLTKGKLVQPWLGPNRYDGVVTPVPGGGLENDGELKLFFQGGGGFEFSSAFTQLRSRISPDAIPYEEPLPLYHNVAEAGASGSNTSTGDANPSPWQPSNIFNAAPSHQYQHLPSAPPQFHSYAPGAPLEPQPDTNSRMDRPLQQQAPPNPY
ncbi:hypothetical protein BASA60_011166 [Batrachochytrium salamandrivorans]|nr:hypothetical protein BASA60_011166 [Batrachochytrium salamandrivorans]